MPSERWPRTESKVKLCQFSLSIPSPSPPLVRPVTHGNRQVRQANRESHGSSKGKVMKRFKDFGEVGIGRTETWRVLGPASLANNDCKMAVCCMLFRWSFFMSRPPVVESCDWQTMSRKNNRSLTLPSLKCSILLLPLSLSHGLYSRVFLLV